MHPYSFLSFVVLFKRDIAEWFQYFIGREVPSWVNYAIKAKVTCFCWVHGCAHIDPNVTSFQLIFLPWNMFISDTNYIYVNSFTFFFLFFSFANATIEGAKNCLPRPPSTQRTKHHWDCNRLRAGWRNDETRRWKNYFEENVQSEFLKS